MPPSFAELFARVPKGKRDDKVKVILAVHCLAGGEGATVTAAEVRNHLKLHLGKKAPKNVLVTLPRAAPYVEPAKGTGRQRRWRLTGAGAQFLRELLGADAVAGPQVPMLNFKELHPAVQHAAGPLLHDGYYSEAVGRAAKALNLMVRQKTGRTRDDGVGMMHQVFTAKPSESARLHLTDLADQSKLDEQEGVRFLMAGVQAAVANVDKHAELGINDPIHAMELLAMLSFLARIVDRCRKVDP
jgi:uncharacterized protein (TIGR02391 family)